MQGGFTKILIHTKRKVNIKKIREYIKIMGASASLFRKGEYPTEKDLDIIIDIFTKMKFYSSGKDKDKLSTGESFSISFTNDHWRRKWDDDDYQWDSLDDNDHIIIYFFRNQKNHMNTIFQVWEKQCQVILFLMIYHVEKDFFRNFCTDILSCFLRMYLWRSTFIQRMI